MLASYNIALLKASEEIILAIFSSMWAQKYGNISNLQYPSFYSTKLLVTDLPAWFPFCNNSKTKQYAITER